MRKFTLACIAMLAAAFLHAQKPAIEIGIKLGPSFSTWTGDDADAPSEEANKKMKIGVHGGAFVIIPITTSLSFQPELLFSSEGVKYDFTDGEKITATTNYLNLPLLLRLQTESGFYAIVGPQLGFSLGGKIKYEYDGDSESEDMEDMRGLIFSGAIGAGYRSPKGFGVYLRYTKSFSTVFDYGDDFDDEKIYSSVISLSVFYMLNLAKKK